MPIHDWTRVDSGIFHHFRQCWIGAVADVLNRKLLPSEYYALVERHAVGFEPEVLTLKTREAIDADDIASNAPATRPLARDGGNGASGVVVLTAEPRVRVTAETDLDFYRRKQNVVAVRHVSGDHLVAIVEVVSKGNKSGRKAFEDFIRKAAEFLSHRVHLLVLDLQPPTPRDPQGVHGAIWDAIAGQDYRRPDDKPLTLASYEAGTSIRAFVEPVTVRDVLIDMPLFPEPGQYVAVPLEETYQTAFDSVPRRWRMILESAGTRGNPGD